MSPFFHALNGSFNQRKGKSSSKHMGNLAWVAMTCCQTQPPLFEDLSNKFVCCRECKSRRRTVKSSHIDLIDRARDILDPMTLCQWANAFTKVGYVDERLFRVAGISARG